MSLYLSLKFVKTVKTTPGTLAMWKLNTKSFTKEVSLLSKSKYEPMFCAVSAAIVERVPNALTMRNQIPKQYLDYDLYCNLIPNEDEQVSYYQQVPRTGAFEVSYKGLVSL